MKKYAILCLALAAAAGSAFGQVTLDNFESGVTPADWAITGFGTVAAYSTSGANATANAMQLNDNGFSFSATKTYPAGVVPANGNYKITFWYQNGHLDAPMRNAKVQVNGVDQFQISGAGAGTPVTTWTQAETGVFALTTADPIVFAVVANNEVTIDVKMLLDEIILEPVTVVPITNKVRPLTGTWLAGTVELTVVPSGGSGTYTSVGFDIGNNSTIDSTDSTSGDGFSYSWDTTGEADGAIQVRIVTTDNAALTGETVVSFTLDNAKGRETLFTSDFEAWTGGIPDGWTRVDYDNGNPAVSGTPGAIISEETANPYAGSKSLHINYPANPDPNRYTVISSPFAADRTDYQVSFAYRGGSFTRLAYFSSDDGVSWRTTSHLFDPGAGGAWGEKIDAAWDLGITDTALLPQNLAITTHFFGLGDLFIDNVAVAASLQVIVTPTAVDGNWDLYR